VAVLAADLPFLTAATVDALRRAVTSSVDGAVLTDDEDRPQWLCGVWRTESLRRRLDALDVIDHSLRGMAEGLAVARVAAAPAQTAPAQTAPAQTAPAYAAPAWFDCDTEDDARRAEEWMDGSAGAVDR
jgi:molybdopterin-guanine dinucleotide biosynthesis protein A